MDVRINKWSGVIIVIIVIREYVIIAGLWLVGAV